jgi:hypothetical protein
LFACLLAALEFELKALCLARQVLYNLSHTSSCSALVILEIGFLFMLRLAWTMILLFGAQIIGMHHHTQFFPCWDCVSQTFLLGLAFS